MNKHQQDSSYRNRVESRNSQPTPKAGKRPHNLSELLHQAVSAAVAAAAAAAAAGAQLLHEQREIRLLRKGLPNAAIASRGLPD